MKKLEYSIPEGYEIDLEVSTKSKIILKKKPLHCSDIINETKGNYLRTYTVSSSKHELKLEALNDLLYTAKYLNNGWVPDWEDSSEAKYFIVLYKNSFSDTLTIKVWSDTLGIIHSPVYFKERKLAEEAIKILGEDCIKTALDSNY